MVEAETLHGGMILQMMMTSGGTLPCKAIGVLGMHDIPLHII